MDEGNGSELNTIVDRSFRAGFVRGAVVCAVIVGAGLALLYSYAPSFFYGSRKEELHLEEKCEFAPIREFMPAELYKVPGSDKFYLIRLSPGRFERIAADDPHNHDA